MGKFRVGDWVKYSNDYMCGTGVIRAINDSSYCVDCFKMLPNGGHIFGSKYGHKFKEIMPDNTGWNFSEKNLIKIDNPSEVDDVHIGDRIELVHNLFGETEKGYTGTIVGFPYNKYYAIRFDAKYNIDGHTCQGILPDNSKQGYFVNKEFFKVIDSIIGNVEPEIQNVEPEIQTVQYSKTEEKAIKAIRKLFKI